MAIRRVCFTTARCGSSATPPSTDAENRDRPGLLAPGGPKAGLAAFSRRLLLLLRSPQLLPRGSLLLRDRLCRLGDQLRGLAQALEDLLGHLVTLARAERLEHLLVRDLDPLGVGD